MTETKIYWKHKMSETEYRTAREALEGNSFFSPNNYFSSCQEQLYRNYFIPNAIQQLARVSFYADICIDEDEEIYEQEYVEEYLWLTRYGCEDLPKILHINRADRHNGFEWPEMDDGEALEYLCASIDEEYDYEVDPDDIDDWEVLETTIQPKQLQDGYQLNLVANIPIQLLHNTGGFPLDLEDVI